MAVLPPSQEQRDAASIIRETLRLLGLASEPLIQWAYDSLVAGNSIDQVLLELEERPEFKAAFPEIEARRRMGQELGVTFEPIGPGEILQYRTQAKALMHTFGLPESFYSNNSNFYELIINDVSLEELNSRLELSSRRVANAPPEVRSVFEEVFGTDSDQALFLAFTNTGTTLPALEDMVQMAEAGGAARRLGFGLSQAEMTRIADINVSYDQAVQGFAELGQRRSLFDETISERQDLTVGGEGVSAAFNIGTEGQAVEERAKSRAAETAGGTGSLLEQRGISGLGEAGKR